MPRVLVLSGASDRGTGFIASVLPWVEIKTGAGHIWRNHLQKLLEGFGSLMLILDYLRQWLYPWKRETWFFLSWRWDSQASFEVQEG